MVVKVVKLYMHYIHVDENFLVFLEHGDQPERESSAHCLNLINLFKEKWQHWPLSSVKAFMKSV